MLKTAPKLFNNSHYYLIYKYLRFILSLLTLVNNSSGLG
jgi:hypothetical protein